MTDQTPEPVLEETPPDVLDDLDDDTDDDNGTRPTWGAWLRGERSAMRAGRAALRTLDAFHPKSSRDVRKAVATQQKRWGVTPDGALGSDQWTRLLDEGAST